MIKYQYGFEHLDKVFIVEEDKTECELESEENSAALKSKPRKIIPPKAKVSLNI